MGYRIFPFIITDCEEYSVIQNAKNTVILKDSLMISFFHWVEKDVQYNISKEQLREFFNEEVDEAIRFMKNNSLLSDANSINMEFEKITVVSNDKTFIDSMRFNAIGRDENITYELLPNDISDFHVNNTEDLYIFFLNPFNYRHYSELVNIVKEYNIVSRFGFYYNHSIFLSNYYKKEWYNPCPMCFFGNVESSLRGMSKASNTTSFQTLLDLIYKKDPKFEIKNKFSNYSILIFVNTLLDELNYIDNTHINNVSYIDFNRNTVMSDQSMHWELCDCYE